MSFENRICGECVSDGYLRDQIRSSAEQSLECDYCGIRHPTIELNALAEQCDVAIERFYEASSLSDDVVIHDRTPKGEPLNEVLQRLLGGSEQLREDIAILLGEIWFDRDSMESRYGEDPWFVEATTHPEVLSAAWRQMEHRLQHEARLVNPAVAAVLEEVFGSLLNYQTRDGTPVLVEAGPGCEWNTFFRARVFQTLKELEDALSHPERNLGAPPEGTGPAGRMNCAGVSVFYGAGDRMTTLSEVRPPVGSHVAVGEFKVIRSLRLLNLDSLAAIDPALGGSRFDPATQAKVERGQFLKTLNRMMTMPVMPELEHRDYLITQAIADFLATHAVLKLDGIIFPSAQHLPPTQQGPHSLQPQHRNVILFSKAANVLRAGPAPRPLYGVQLFEYEGDTACFAPQISSSDVPAVGTAELSSQGTPNEPSLELNTATIEIHEIRAVEFTTASHRVFQHLPRDRPLV